MTVINVSDKFQLFPDDLKTFDKLPKGTYVVRFNKMEGFSLMKRDDLKVDEKMYGNHKNKAQKALKTFDVFDRSLGIILSGDKGIGKTMFTRYMAEQFVNEKELPVILVDQPYQGVADFISSIKQEAMVLFDEFEKVFDSQNENIEQQDSLLGLFDGLSTTKHMYVITVNDLRRLSPFMQNRTGRFHYHFRFEYPTGDEVREYIKDNSVSIDNATLEKVVDFSAKVKVTFDTLRSIVFEISQGYSFSEAIEDLNISRGDNTRYEITLIDEDGKEYPVRKTHELDLFNSEIKLYCEIPILNDYFEICMSNQNIESLPMGAFSLSDIEPLQVYNRDNDEYEDIKFVNAVLTPRSDASIKYAV